MLDAAQVKHFNTRGYIADLPLLDQSEVNAHRAWSDDVRGKIGAHGEDVYPINGY